MITGKEFNKQHQGKRFVKLTNKYDIANSFKFKEGLNISILKLDKWDNVDTKINLVFYEYEKFGLHINFNRYQMIYMWDVEILDNANVIVLDKLVKCDEFILTNKQSIWNTNELYLESIKQCGFNLKHIKNQTDEICSIAIKQHGTALKYVKNQINKLCMDAVKQNGQALQYVKIQTYELCMEAIKQNGLALYWIKNKTNEFNLTAVKQNGSALQYIDTQTDELCIEAVKQDGYALRYVTTQTNEICLEAVKQNGFALTHVKNQTKEICTKAVKFDINVACYIKNEELMTQLTDGWVFKPYCNYVRKSECTESDIAMWEEM